jgi:RNA polymerase sigma-70 factor (ECF subfamily)
VAEHIVSFNSPLMGGTRTAPEEPALPEEGDERLLEGLREGNEAAYETLIQRFQQPVYNLVGRLLGDPSEACDVVQEVFLKVFRKVGSFRGESSLRTWIYRIAMNEVHNHCRWNGRHRRQEVGLESGEGSYTCRDALTSPGDSPFDYALDHERRRLVEAALADLNPSFRSVVVLRDIEDLSYEEIARILRLPLGTVKSRILRGRDALRRGLEKRLEPEPGFQWSPQLVE